MRGRLRVELKRLDGELVGVRQACNTVMRGGAQMVAELFAGQGGPISHMGVGTSDAAPEDVSVTALQNVEVGESPPLEGATTTPVSPGSVRFEVQETRRLVTVRLRATLPADAAVGRIREAGLLQRTTPDEGEPVDRLYNRVIFAPIDKGDDHELTLFWEVDFPFGDLNWAS